MIGMNLIFEMRSPAAIVRIPPHAIKSASIVGVISGTILLETKNNDIKITICGKAIRLTAIPSVVAKMAAVKKSSTDFERSIEASPLMPSVRTPKIPNPLAQHSVTIVTYCSISIPLFIAGNLFSIQLNNADTLSSSWTASPMAAPIIIDNTTMSKVCILVIETIPIAMADSPNIVNNVSLTRCGTYLPAAHPTKPPSRTDKQLTPIPIGIIHPLIILVFPPAVIFATYD